MATKPRVLRVATAADIKPAPPKSLADAIETGTYLEILVAQRGQMVKDLSGATGPALAALHRQIALHSKEIAALQTAAAEEAAQDAGLEVSDEAFSTEAL